MALTKISGEVIESGINIGIVTASTINVGSAVTVHTGGFRVGTSDLHSTGISVRNVNSTGVITATTFSGSLTGNVTGNATGLSGTPNITVGAINASSAVISGNVSVAGTITYEDTTNVDSIGVITARSGIHVTGGSIGIGTTNPSSTVDVLGLQANTGATSANTPTGTLRLAYDGGAVGGNYGSSLVFSQRWNSPSNGQVAVGQITGVKIAGDGNFGGGLAFFTSNGSGNDLAERARLDSSGNFGLGINNPQARLDVRQDSSSTTNMSGIRVQNTNITGDSQSGISFFNYDSFGAKIYTLRTGSPQGVLVFATNNGNGIAESNVIERLRIDSSGNFGLGTNNPQARLDVAGLTRITQNTNGQNGLVVSMPTGVENTASGIRVQGYSPAIELLDKDSVQNWYIAIDDNVTNNFQIARGYGPGQGINGVIEITSSDNVGIGITNPSNKLVVDGYIQTPNSSNGSVGLEIGYKKSVTITGSFSANTWYNTGIDRTTDTGIYLLNAYVDTYNTGQSYQMSYIGWFVMPNRATNSGSTSDITLHRAGHAPNGEVIQFRTLLTPAVNDSKIYLQWLSNFNLTLNGGSGNNIQVAIHKFATAFNS
jgi:hypothetical protein